MGSLKCSRPGSGSQVHEVLRIGNSVMSPHWVIGCMSPLYAWDLLTKTNTNKLIDRTSCTAYASYVCQRTSAMLITGTLHLLRTVLSTLAIRSAISSSADT